MTSRKKVHITDAGGNLLYTRLWDDGSDALVFDSGYGFVDRLDVIREHWQVQDGWKRTAADKYLESVAGDALQKGVQQFNKLYGQRADEVRSLIDAAAEAEECFGLDDLEQFGK